MFDEDEWSKLVDRLTDLTHDSKLKWRDQAGQLQATVGQTTYRIGSVDDDGRMPYYLAITLEGKEEPVGRLESEPLDEEQWMAPSAAQRLIDLRHHAVRSAMGAPQIFGALMADLEVIDPTDTDGAAR